MEETKGVGICIVRAMNMGGGGPTSFAVTGSWTCGMGNVAVTLGMSSEGRGRSRVVRRVEGVDAGLEVVLDIGMGGMTAGSAGVGGIGI